MSVQICGPAAAITSSANLRSPAQRTGQAGCDSRCHGTHLGIERLPVGEFLIGSGERPERLPGGLAGLALYQQAAGYVVPAGRGERGHRSGRELKVDAEPGDQLIRQQRYQVGVPAESGRMGFEQPLAHRCPAGSLRSFQQGDRPARLGRQNRRNQPVVATPDHDYISAAHRSSLPLAVAPDTVRITNDGARPGSHSAPHRDVAPVRAPHPGRVSAVTGQFRDIEEIGACQH